MTMPRVLTLTVCLIDSSCLLYYWIFYKMYCTVRMSERLDEYCVIILKHKKSNFSVSLMQSLSGRWSAYVCQLRCTDDLILSGEGSYLRVWKKTKETETSDTEDNCWRSDDCFLDAGNGCNLKDFIILDKIGNVVAASNCKGHVYACDTVKRLKRVI